MSSNYWEHVGKVKKNIIWEQCSSNGTACLIMTDWQSRNLHGSPWDLHAKLSAKVHTLAVACLQRGWRLAVGRKGPQDPLLGSYKSKDCRFLCDISCVNKRSPQAVFHQTKYRTPSYLNMWTSVYYVASELRIETSISNFCYILKIQ